MVRPVLLKCAGDDVVNQQESDNRVKERAPDTELLQRCCVPAGRHVRVTPVALIGLRGQLMLSHVFSLVGGQMQPRV